MNPHDLHLFYEPAGTLRLTVGEEKSYPKVALYQSAPLTRPGKYIALLDGKGEEIALVPSLDDLTASARAVAEEEIRRRYLTAQIQAITGLRQEFGVTYWHVLTDKGERDFVMQSLSESCVWLSEAHLLLVDVDGNRFEIEDRSALDAESRRRLELVL